MSGLKNLVLMAVLENTSAEFVPYLEKLAIQLGSNDLKYTKIHGEADVSHADQFSWAVEHEKEFYADPNETIQSATEASIEFLRNVLS